MDYRIEMSVKPQWQDARGQGVVRRLSALPGLPPVRGIRTRSVYTVSADITPDEAAKVAQELADPVTRSGIVGETPSAGLDYTWLIRVGFKPGVTDNVARTAWEAIGDIIGRKLSREEQVFSSIEYLVDSPEMTREQAQRIATGLLANVLIESVDVFSRDELANASIPLNKPVIKGLGEVIVRDYDLEVSDEELMELSHKGTLALSLEEMKSIQGYFRQLGRKPTDVEMEVLAQTWSEHCKHKIFAADIDYTTPDGKTVTISSLYKSYIKKSTKELQAEVPWLVSVFTDNAGVIRFNDRFDLVYKAETHNSPSALDPYGGAMTGIVGVNRDPLGTGQGADLLLNVWGYCLGSPFTDPINVPEGLLHPRRLRDGVHKGVIDGGNQSGIPYAVGWEYFDDRYIGKPLVYCGTVGTLPRKVGDRNGWEKFIESGDYIVMTGGRIGKDGIHGATFSSEELHKDSPVQAVQIGDPITQKRMSDFIHEARERLLYRFVTDNGAGGLSSSVGEMADVCGGCDMDLAKAPLKYSGLQPWEILVSEAQERMSFAVAPERLDEFLALAAARDVEATVLGRFNHSGKFHITYGDRVVADIDIKFMHEGLPKLHLKAAWKPPVFDEPVISGRDLSADLVKLIGRLNICSDEYKARQYDHEVKGLSIIKPFTGVCRDVASDATVTLAEPLAKEGIVLSAGILPRYSDIDTYHMMASIIDLAVRRSVAAGADPDHIAGLDNFCWPDPVQSEKTPDGEYKLAQLVRANMALYDSTKAFKVPCISGKDSMKNDSTRGGRKISIPPTVLFSTIARIDDVSHAVSLDAKFAGDAVYVLGETKAELGGSEYFAMLDAVGNNVPKVDIPKASALYHALAEVIKADIPSSIISPALGGLAIAAAKSAIGGRLGMTIDLDKLPGIENLKDAEALFSESNSRFLLTCRPERCAELEKMLAGHVFARVGTTTEKQELVFMRGGKVVASATLADLITAYKSTLEGI